MEQPQEHKFATKIFENHLSPRWLSVMHLNLAAGGALPAGLRAGAPLLWPQSITSQCPWETDRGQEVFVFQDRTRREERADQFMIHALV